MNSFNKSHLDRDSNGINVETLDQKTGNFKILHINNFGLTTSEPWCCVNFYEIKSKIAIVNVSFSEFLIDGTTTNYIEKPPKIGFNSIPSKEENPRVSRIRKCVGKGIHVHIDESKNIWCTRKGKNSIFIKGNFIGEDIINLNNELTQGVPFKILDKEKFDKELFTKRFNKEILDNYKDSCKVVISFIKDPKKDEELPLWIEISVFTVSNANETPLKYAPAINILESRNKYNARKNDYGVKCLPVGELTTPNKPNIFSNSKLLGVDVDSKTFMTNKNEANITPFRVSLNKSSPKLTTQNKHISPSIDVMVNLKENKSNNKSKKSSLITHKSFISSISNVFSRSKTQDEMNIRKNYSRSIASNTLMDPIKDIPSTADIVSGKLVQNQENHKYSGMSYTKMIKETRFSSHNNFI